MSRPAWIEQLRVAARGPELRVVEDHLCPDPVIEIRSDDHEALAAARRRGYRPIEVDVRHVRCTDGALWDAVVLALVAEPAPVALVA